MRYRYQLGLSLPEQSRHATISEPLFRTVIPTSQSYGNVLACKAVHIVEKASLPDGALAVNSVAAEIAMISIWIQSNCKPEEPFRTPSRVGGPAFYSM